MYVVAYFLVSEVDTVAWYFTFLIVHFPGREQFSLLRQLQLSGSWAVVELKILLQCYVV